MEYSFYSLFYLCFFENVARILYVDKPTMKEIIVYLFTFALISLLLNFFPQNNKSLPIPHLSTSTSIIILDGSTSYHPSLPLY